MSPKDKGVVVHRGNGRTRSCTDVSEADSGLGVCADGSEVHIIHGRLNGFVPNRADDMVRNCRRRRESRNQFSYSAGRNPSFSSFF